MRVLPFVVVPAVVIIYGHSYLSKENLVIAVVGTLTLIGLLRVLTHETVCAAQEMFPALTEIAEGYYCFKRRLRELRSESRRAPGRDA